jgi:hypothetical protein
MTLRPRVSNATLVHISGKRCAAIIASALCADRAGTIDLSSVPHLYRNVVSSDSAVGAPPLCETEHARRVPNGVKTPCDRAKFSTFSCNCWSTNYAAARRGRFAFAARDSNDNRACSSASTAASSAGRFLRELAISRPALRESDATSVPSI